MKTENNQPKHTPGPWEYGKLNNYEYFDVEHKGTRICSLFTHMDGDTEEQEEAEANAQLIASAPDMLEALQKCVKAMENSNCDSLITDQAKAIIKKATGQ